MVAFTRTPQGIANSRLFHGVDYVIYCEGRRHLDAARSPDAGFWYIVITDVSKKVKLKIIPKGGREDVDAIARSLANVQHHRTIVAYDRDYTDLKGVLPPWPYSIVTFGYSFENDLLYESVISCAIASLIPGVAPLNVIRKHVKDSLAHLESLLARPCHLDQLMSRRYCAMFNRKGLAFQEILVGADHDVLPTSLNRPRVSERWQMYVDSLSTADPVGMRLDRRFWRRVYGHLGFWLLARIVRSCIKSVGVNSKVGDDIIMGVALSSFKQKYQLAQLKEARTYYRSAVKSAFAAAA